MTEEESGSVLGGFGEAAGAAWDAAGQVFDAEVNAAQGVGNFVAGAADNVVSGVAHMTGDAAMQAEYDQAFDQRMGASDQSFSDAGDNLDTAYTDVVGE
jgi:hypothetical protein